MRALVDRRDGRIAVRARVAATLAAALAAPVALAFPDRPVRIVVPYAAGGNADVLGRLVAQRVAEKWRQPVIVDNRPGGSAIIGSTLVARAAPDGHTLLLTGTSHTTNPSMHRKLPYDTQRDLAPVTLFATAPLIAVVPTASPLRSIGDLVARGRSAAGGVTYATSGHGGGPHLAAELFRVATGANFVHVPFKGATQALNDVMAGNVQVMFATLITAVPHVRDGKRLLGLGVTSRKRSAMLPDVPTIEEAGVAGYEATSWYGMFAAGGTPEPVVEQIAADIAAELRTHLQDHLGREGAVVVANRPAEFRSWIDAEIAKWRTVIARSGIAPE